MRQPSSNPSTDQSANFFWILMLLIGFGVVLWLFEKKDIITFIFYVRYYEIVTITFFVDVINTLAGWVHLPEISKASLENWQHYMATTTWKEVTFQDVEDLSNAVGDWMRYPVVGLMTGLGVYIFFRHKGIRFRSLYNMSSLKSAELPNWPQIVPVAKLNLVKKSLDKGAWAMSQLPLAFAKKHDLLEMTTKANKRVWIIHRRPAYRVFAIQLGSLWRGIQALPIHVQALMAIFLAKAQREHDIAHKYIDQIAASAGGGKLDFTGVSSQLMKYQNCRILSWLIPRHAYVNTLMASLLEIARTDGVLATSEFLWLKPIDRRLWFMLNAVGRQTAFVEIAGVYAHWQAEKRYSCALRVPVVKEAVNALETAVGEILYVDESERWQTSGD